VKVHAGNVKTATAPLPKRKSAKNGQDIVIPPEQLFKPRAVTYTSTSAKASAVPWPLDRLNQVGSQLDGNSQKPTGMLPPVIGQNVPVYIMDTGVLATHVEFGGRVELVHDQFPAQTQRHGHGTHVASDCCGNTIGPNPFTKIYDVRTLDSSGSAYWFDITEAAEGALAHCLAIGTKNTTGCIWNQSFGGAGNPNSTDAEPLAAILGYAREDCDALIIAAAGNSADDTCMTIPAGYSSISQGRVMAVGATDRYDKFASFSNRGPCNFINAPGVDVLGAWNTGNNAYAESDGTSFASPYTAGLASIYYLWFQGNWSQENPGELRADHVRSFMYTTALCAVKNLPARTTCALIHYSSAAIDPSAPLQDPSPLTPLRSSDASALTVGALFVVFVVIMGLVIL
jgi:subtilisin family serine protease